MKYAIIENEFHGREHLKRLLSDLRPKWELMYESDSIAGTVKAIGSMGLPDLFFMDIELDDGISFELFRKVEIASPVVFTTAYDEYCLQAFKVNSLDYIVKPITHENLLFAIRKFENASLFSIRSNVEYEVLASSLPENRRTPRILISRNDSYSYINIEDVAWFENEDKCIFAVSLTGKRHFTTYSTLNEIEDIVPYDQFFRIARNFLINVTTISSVKKSFNYKLSVTIKSGDIEKTVTVSSARRKDFLKWFGCGG